VTDADPVPYASTTDWSALADRLRAASSAVLLTHRKPDGDAIGSLAAAYRMLDGIIPTREVWIVGPADPSLQALVADVPMLPVTDGPATDLEPDVILVMDTGAWSQLEPLEPWLRPRHERVLGIDHHARGDDVASMRIVQPTAASTTRMLMDLADALGLPITRALAEPMLLGLATDTGWFRHSNADADAFRAVARLLDAGVDKNLLYQQVEETHRPARLALAARALSSTRYVRGGEVAIQMLTPADFEETGGGSEDTVGLVNVPMAIGDVRVSIMASEPDAGLTKLSFRGKPGGDGWRDADVNAVAGAYGGGGHRFAAGARIEAPMTEAIERLVADLEARPSLREGGPAAG
jgi:phosphoesterase RecJ-like protein